jgi:hypothetical protein
MLRKCIKENKFLSFVKVIPIDPNNYEQQIPLADVKDYLIVSHDEDNTVISKIRDAVIKNLEEQTKRPFIPSNVQFIMEVNSPTVPLPRLPLIELSPISKRTGANTWEVLTSDQYEYLGDDLILEVTGTIDINYKAGYAINSLPHDLRLAALAETAYRYENRGDKSLPAELCGTANQYISNHIVSSYL